MNEEVKYIIVLLYIIIGMVVYGHYYKEAAERDKTVEELRKTTDAWLAVIIFWVIIEVVFNLAAAKFVHLFCGNNFKHNYLLQ